MGSVGLVKNQCAAFLRESPRQQLLAERDGAAGKLYVSINAGCFRLLVPQGQHRVISDMRPKAKHIVVSMLPSLGLSPSPSEKTPLSRPSLRWPTQNPAGSRHQFRSPSSTTPGNLSRPSKLSGPSKASLPQRPRTPPPQVRFRRLRLPRPDPGNQAHLRSAYGAICSHKFKPKNQTDDIFLAQILGHKLLGPNASLSVGQSYVSHPVEKKANPTPTYDSGGSISGSPASYTASEGHRGD
jgi:hypothetical protein